MGSSSKQKADVSKGVIKGKKEGVASITAAGNTSSNKNSICRVNVTVSPNVGVKSLKLSRKKTYKLNTYLKNPENYRFTVAASNGSAVNIANGEIVTPDGKGSTIIYAESLAGGKNYTILIKTA